MWRTTPAPVRGALVKRLGELLAEHKDPLADLVTPRGGQDPLRGARRGPGDDRHLRLRGRAVAPALRRHDALGAARAPADGDVAPARRGRCHLRLQLPGGRVVVEHRGRAGLRRRGGLEAVRADAADRAGLRRAARPGGGRRRRTGRSQPGAARRLRRWPSASSTTRACRWSARPARCGWAAPSPSASPPGSASRCSSSAATTPRSSRPRPTSTSRPAASSSRPPGPPVSAAPACAG